MARTKVKESPNQIQAMIFNRARDDASMRRELLLFSRRVHKYWRRIAPVGDPSGVRYVENFGGPLPKHWNQTDSNAGSYKAGIVNRKGKPDPNGLPTRMISATDHKSHWIEYGTGGTTPTPEFACRQRTATRFGAMSGVTARQGLVNKSGRRGTTRLNVSGRPSGKPGKAKTYDAVEPAA
jgi:hypothetical protein